MRVCIVDDGTNPQLHRWAVQAGLELQHTLAVDIRVYAGPDELNFAKEHADWLQYQGYERLFESCYLPKHSRGESRSRLVHALFSLLGTAEYCAAITADTNIGCYNVLFRGAVERLCVERARVLDVGCGPGTVLESVAAHESAYLAGFDFVDANVRASRDRGMEAVGEDGLAKMPVDAFDVLLSCFALHYEALSPTTIGHLVRVLRVGGILAANFHKGRGIDWFTQALGRSGAFELTVVESAYGPVMFARKVGSAPVGSGERAE